MQTSRTRILRLYNHVHCTQRKLTQEGVIVLNTCPRSRDVGLIKTCRWSLELVRSTIIDVPYIVYGRHSQCLKWKKEVPGHPNPSSPPNPSHLPSFLHCMADPDSTIAAIPNKPSMQLGASLPSPPVPAISFSSYFPHVLCNFNGHQKISDQTEVVVDFVRH